MASYSSPFGFRLDRSTGPRGATPSTVIERLPSARDRVPSTSVSYRTGRSLSPTVPSASSIPRKALYGPRLPIPISARTRAQNPDLDRPAKTAPTTARTEQKESQPLDDGRDLRTPTPSLVSISSVSTPDSPKRNVLRRKPSVIGTYIAQQRQTQAAKVDDDVSPSVSSTHHVYGLGLSTANQHQPVIDRFPQDWSRPTTGQGSVASPLSSNDSRPYQTPTPLSNISVTPSLVYTDSPSGYSLRTTPTSYSSHSPYINDSPQTNTGQWVGTAKTQASDTIAKATRLSITAAQASHFSVVSTSRRPSASAASRVPSAKHKSQQATSTQPRARTPPPELAHLMSDTPTTTISQISPKSFPSDRLSHPKSTAQTSLPRLDTFIGNKEPIPKRLASNTQDQLATPTTSIRRKPIDSPTKSNPARPSSAVGQSHKTKSGLSRDRSTDGRTTPVADAAQKASSRFGFFARKKSATAPSTDEKSKFARKGPVAGTGYEGFGKYASRRKSGSTGSSSAYGSVASGGLMTYDRAHVSRNSDASSLDDFLQHRLEPVYLRGDGNASDPRGRISESTVDDEPSETVFGSPRTAVSSQSSMHGPSSPASSALAAHGLGIEQPKSIDAQLALRVRHDTFDKQSVSGASLAALGSVPRPSTAAPRLSIANSDSSLWEALPDPSLSQEHRKSMDNVRIRPAEERSTNDETSLWPVAAKTSSRAKMGSKWNWFSRSRTSLAESELDTMTKSPDLESPACTSSQPTAHYAYFDQPAGVDFEDLQSIMEEADRAYWESRPNRYKSVSTERLDQPAAPSIPGTFRLVGSPRTTPANPEVCNGYQAHPSTQGVSRESLESEKSTDSIGETARPSRLIQVGRIPQVVSKRDRQRQLPAQSFSRPFVDTQHRPDHRPPQKVAATVESTFTPLRNEKTKQQTILGAIDAVAGIDELTPLAQSSSGRGSPEKAFLEFKPRKDSQTSFSSSSRTSFVHAAAATAVLPSPGEPLSPDEIWEEYDDLIADVVKPLTGQVAVPEPGNSLSTATTTTSSDYFPKAATHVKAFKSTKHELGPSLLDLREELQSMYSPTRTEAGAQTSTAFETSTSSNERHSLLHKTSDPSTTLKRAGRGMSLPDGMALTQPSSPISTRSRSSGLVDPMSMANLRFGALMVGKWLSFGRVLVSPVHFELESAGPGERILIIDGLGKDWSYYCALTYSNAQVYSLGPWTAKSAKRHSLGGSLDQLPNYRHFHYPELGTNMPFPKAFFSTVVLRFPQVTTEVALRSTIAECKRVLRPGGYIELSTLDLDLNNMGNKARRELRELKTKMHADNPDACLRSVSDNLQHLLGRKGFDNLTRCFVGVPVAGVVSESRDASRDESVGILELMKDSSEQGDRDITKMVAKVGRWWYSRCYEQGVLPDGDLSASMWTSKALLKECESMGTTFKLLICYAQKPTLAKRRAKSL